MTKQNKMTIKLGVVSAFLSYVTYLFIELAKNGTPMESALGQMGAFVVGVFAGIGIISTIVVFLVEE